MIGGGFNGNFPRKPTDPRHANRIGVVKSGSPHSLQPLQGKIGVVKDAGAEQKPGTVNPVPPYKVPPPIVTQRPQGNHRRSSRDFHVIILSANPENLKTCLDALAQNEKLEAGRVIVVDDGARRACEDIYTGIEWLEGIKPFVFARNANLGIQWANTDVILLNDDALLMTENGFSRMSRAVHDHERMGICSAAIRGEVGNKNQYWRPTQGIRSEPRRLSFMCVFITRELLDQVGLLDERFVDYGWEDDDLCRRTLLAGYRLGVYDGCVVDHSRLEASSYRTKPDFPQLITSNRLRYEAKWRSLS